MRAISQAQRRARLGRRHRLAPDTGAGSVEEAAAAVVGLHASDPASVFLSARARVPTLVPTDVERALYDDATLLKHMCMRRTMFVLPRDLVPVAQAACGDAVAATMRKRLAAELEAAGVTGDAQRWLAQAERETVEALASLGPSTGAQLSRAVPLLQTKLLVAPGKAYGGDVAVATRVLTLLATEGHIVRGRPNGSWTSSQHRWLIATGDTGRLDAAAATTTLVQRWLACFGPATIVDVAWWTGLGLTRVRRALRTLDVEEVDLDGEVGVVLPDDTGDDEVDPWVALLPALDPATMGWQRRDWYLGDHKAAVFDRNGNGGPTIWCDGRIVGGWVQGRDGRILHRFLEDVGARRRRLVEQEVDRLQTWLGRIVVVPRFPSPLDKELRG